MDAISLLLDRVPGLGRFRGDIKGGLLSAAVAIPLAMGYGMFGFVVLGNDYFLDGALAGLLTAAVVGIVCVALGDKSANVYAPRVITTFFIGILLYGLVHSESPILKAGGLGLILAVLFSIILLGGMFQALFGADAPRHGHPVHSAAGDVRLPERRGAACCCWCSSATCSASTRAPPSSRR